MRSRLVVALVLAACLAGCSRGQVVAQASADSGQATSAAAKTPRRIVSTVPAVTEMLFAIGAGPLVVAVSSYDTWPPEVKSLPRVGGLLDPDIERILALRPDLVITHGSQAEVEATLRHAGIATFPYVLGGLDNLTRTMRQLGRRVGREQQADAAARAIEARFDAIRQRVAGRTRPRTLVVFGREPGSLRGIDASGGVGFLSDIVDLAGGDNVFKAVKRESIRVDTEAILAARPEIIIDLQYGREMSPEDIDRARAVWKGLPALPAVRTGGIALLVGNEFVVPGPRLVNAAEAIADVIHPRPRTAR